MVIGHWSLVILPRRDPRLLLTMKRSSDIPLVTTIRERCRVCYTCVRECPAKAIRVAGGQAEVIDERCIGCGNCTRVCSQHAKAVLDSGEPVAACLAPSFPAEFPEYRPARLAAVLRALGFSHVFETSFGA